jgi:hypothetical protein
MLMSPIERSRPFVVVAACAALLLLPALADAEEGWRLAEPHSDDPSGYTLYIEDSDEPYPGYKAEGWLEAEPEAAAASIMVLMTGEEFVPDGQTRRGVRQDDEVLVLHTHIDMPVMVADRDLAIRITHSIDRETGVHRVDWISADDEVPAPGGGVVRIADARGYWLLVPDRPGRTRATYMTRAHLGGWLPARLISPMMRDQVAGDITRLQQAVQNFTVSAAPPDN